jgi:conjugal transfer ATP-binding protein TraC
MRSIRNFIFGSDAMARHEIERIGYRNKFSEFLPYQAYDPETWAFYNSDETVGFMWECRPLVFANDHTFKILSGLFSAGVPKETVLQFILYADPNVKPILEEYQELKTVYNDLCEQTTQNTVNFFRNGVRGIDRLQGTPIRNFRLFVVLKMPQTRNMTSYLDIRDNIRELLRGAYLYPENVAPGRLINFLAKIFNDEVPEDMGYDPSRPINKQIILSETHIRSEWKKMMIGKKHMRCMTVKKMTPQLDPLTFNYAMGDIWGVQGDHSQINCPFLFTLNILFDSLNAKLHAKCNFVLQQQAVGSFAPSLKRKQEEYLWATGEIERGTRFVRIMPILWHFTRSEEASREASARVKRIWQSRGFVTQEDRGILKILWLAALPFGLYNRHKAVETIDRDFICHSDGAVKCLPIQVDFMGGGEPHNLFVGRKGQLVTFDLFAPNSENYNAIITATSGSGKSFLTNALCYNYFTAGSLIRVVDVGGSYRKLSNIIGGKFVNFSKDSNIVLNPFSNVRDINEDVQSVSAVIAQMVYSNSRQFPNETETTIIKNAVRSVFEACGTEANVDRVYEHLSEPSKNFEEILELECENDNSCVSDIKAAATGLAYNLRSFTTKGNFGKWFNGTSNLDIDYDDFVVLELEELKPQVELFNVVTLQILNYITSNLYLSDRSQRRIIIFDEAWQFFSGKGAGKGETSLLGQIIVEGYRRARKYGGSFITITQSILDMELFGDVGQTIFSNSAYKFFLQSEDFEKAHARKIINYDPFVMNLLKSIKSPRPRYSEIFIDSPAGTGIARLLVDPFSYYLFTSDAFENAEIEKMVKGGLSYAEAFEKMIERQQEQNNIPFKPESTESDDEIKLKLVA